MTRQLYSRSQLESKKLAGLKAIALELNATPSGDKRVASSWVEAILKSQPQSVKEFTEVIKPVATCTDCPHFNSHNDGTDKGWCCSFDRFAREHHKMTQDCINTIESEEQSNYLFHESIEVEQAEVTQPVNLPCVDETHFIGSNLLRCIEVGGEYAAVWNVINDGLTMGEIRMDWSCFWSHNLSMNLFTIPQEATADLIESSSELTKKPELEVATTDFPNVPPQKVKSDRPEICHKGANRRRTLGATVSF